MEMVTGDKEVKERKVQCVCSEWAMLRMKPLRIKREIEVEINPKIK